MFFSNILFMKDSFGAFVLVISKISSWVKFLRESIVRHPLFTNFSKKYSSSG